MMGKNAWDRRFGLSGLRLGGWYVVRFPIATRPGFDSAQSGGFRLRSDREISASLNPADFGFASTCGLTVVRSCGLAVKFRNK